MKSRDGKSQRREEKRSEDARYLQNAMKTPGEGAWL